MLTHQTLENKLKAHLFYREDVYGKCFSFITNTPLKSTKPDLPTQLDKRFKYEHLPFYDSLRHKEDYKWSLN